MRTQSLAVEIASAALKDIENSFMVPHRPLMRGRGICLRTAGERKREMSLMLAGPHGTRGRESGGAEKGSGTEAEKGTGITSVAEKETAAEGGRVRGTGMQRENDTGIKIQTRGETEIETGKETETELGNLTGKTWTEIGEETVTESENESVRETGSGTDPEAERETVTGIVGKIGVETGTETEIEIGTERGREREKRRGTVTEAEIVGKEAEAEIRKKRKRTVNTIRPRTVIKPQKIVRTFPSLCFMDIMVPRLLHL